MAQIDKNARANIFFVFLISTFSLLLPSQISTCCPKHSPHGISCIFLLVTAEVAATATSLQGGGSQTGGAKNGVRGSRAHRHKSSSRWRPPDR